MNIPRFTLKSILSMGYEFDQHVRSGRSECKQALPSSEVCTFCFLTASSALPPRLQQALALLDDGE